MRKFMFVLFALAISLFGSQCWAQSVTCQPSIETAGPITCSNTFSPGTTTATYDFSRTGDGVLIVQFKTVLTTFSLTVTVSHTIDPIDFTEFPAGTVCVPYSSRNGSRCDEYDFSGNPAVTTGPNGVPVKDTDYKGLIMLRLSYFISSTYAVRTPAFGHAPGDNATAFYSEDILTSYSDSTICGAFGCGDRTMDGSTPGLSAVTALDKPFVENGDSFCSLSLQTAPFHVGQLIEVDYRLTNGTDCSTGIRDKTAGFSLAMTDSNGNFVSRPPLQDKEEANKFHWDNKNQLNEFYLSTVGLAPGNYTITVFSGKISPQTFSLALLVP